MKTTIEITGGISSTGTVKAAFNTRFADYEEKDTRFNKKMFTFFYDSKEEAIQAIKDAGEQLRLDEPDYQGLDWSDTWLTYDTATAKIV